MNATLARCTGLAAVLTLSAGSSLANSTYSAFVDIAGSSATDGFNDLTSSRITRAGLAAGIAGNTASSGHGVTLQRLTGGFYPASFGLYSYSTDSAFSVNVASAIADLGSVTLQTFVSIDTSQGVYGLSSSSYLPTLSYNGGSQRLAATYSLRSVSGGFDMDGNPLQASASNPNYGTFTWDLSSLSTPITSFNVSFGLDIHSNALAFQLDQVSAVPEPETYAFAAIGLALCGWAGWRRSKGRAA